MYGRCMGKSIIFSVFFHFFTMQPNFFLIFLLYGLPSHFCSHSSARMPDLVSEVDSDRRAARASRAWPLPGSGARARASGSGGRAYTSQLPAASCRMAA